MITGAFQSGTGLQTLADNAHVIMFANYNTDLFAIQGDGGIYWPLDADADQPILKIDVDGTPTMIWDESEDAFAFSHGFDITGNIVVSGTVDGIDIATDVAANTTHAGSDGSDHTGLILHSLADATSDFLVASGANTFVKKTLAETGAILEADINHDNLVDFETNEHFTEASIDHGSIAGLTDNDHAQYILRQPIADTIMNEAGGNFDLRIESSSNINAIVLDSGVSSFGLGTATFDATGRNIFTMANGTAPAGGVADQFQLFAKDLTAGKSAPAVVDEDGLEARIVNRQAVVYHSATQTCTTAVWRTMLMNGELYDDFDGHDLSTNNERIYVDETGIYFVWGQIYFATNATGYRQGQIKDGTGNAICTESRNAIDGDTTKLSFCGIREVAGGDYVYMLALQNSGDDLNTAAWSCKLGIVRLR